MPILITFIPNCWMSQALMKMSHQSFLIENHYHLKDHDIKVLARYINIVQVSKNARWPTLSPNVAVPLVPEKNVMDRMSIHQLIRRQHFTRAVEILMHDPIDVLFFDSNS